MKRCSKLLILSMIVFALAGCGDAEEDDGSFSNLSNSANNNNGDPDAGDVDSDADAADQPDVSPDADTGGPDVEEGSRCAKPTALGTLSAGQEHQFDSSLVAPADDLDSSCDLDGVDTGVRVFSMEVDVASRVEFWISLSPSRLDLRRGGCDDAGEVLTCTSGGTYTANLEPGETYHLLVWGDFNQGDFELRADVQEALCSTSEPNWCEADQLNECSLGTSINTYDCLDDCADDAACSADACASAIPVDLSTTTSFTFTGAQRAYTSTWSAQQKSGCGYAPDVDGFDTPNEEAFFEVSGLSAGDELTVESLGAGDFAFFVLGDCNADACVTSADRDENGDQRLVWQVPDSSNYIVVIEALQSRSRDVEFSFQTN